MPTTAELQAYLTKLYAARNAILTGQSYSINGQSLTRVNADWIDRQIKETESRIYKRSNNGDTSARIVFDRGGR